MAIPAGVYACNGSIIVAFGGSDMSKIKIIPGATARRRRRGAVA
jgi:hypothetical protein